MISLARIDTANFSRHSVRGASTFPALEEGVSLNLILQIADGSKESMFRKFYYQESSTRSVLLDRRSLQQKQSESSHI